MREQRRGGKIAMDVEERDAFLASERTCRVATVGGDGAPHVTPLWFVWDGSALWLTSIVRSQRWTDLQREPRISVVVDAGTDFMELRGVEIRVSPSRSVRCPARVNLSRSSTSRSGSTPTSTQAGRCTTMVGTRGSASVPTRS